MNLNVQTFVKLAGFGFCQVFIGPMTGSQIVSPETILVSIGPSGGDKLKVVHELEG